MTKPAKRALHERGARHAIVYWFPATLDPPRGLPVGRQWSICQALSRHTEVVVLSGGTSVVNRPAARQLSETLWFVEGAFGTAWHSRSVKQRLWLPIEQRRLWRAIQQTHRSWTVWLSAPYRAFIPRTLPPRRLVFDLIDPPFGGSDDAHLRLERGLAKLAGATFATAAALEERIRPYARRIYRIPNGCDDLGPLPPFRPPKRTARIGYLGTIDRRFDVGRVAEAARGLPECQFIIGGRVNYDRLAEVDRELRPLSNVELVGEVREQDPGSR